MPREFIDGDRVGYDADGSINQYDFVTLTGERQVAQVSSADGELWGIAMNSAEDGERITIIQHGLYEAHVSDAAEVNDYLTGSTTAGQARTVGVDEGSDTRTVRALEDIAEANRMLVYIS